MIYFDNAATTLQKPLHVADAAARAVGSLASPGRGGYRAAMEAGEVTFLCRCLAGELLGVGEPERVVFTSSATHGLNLAIRSLVKPGDRVVISGWEHNAVTRPLYGLGAEVFVANGQLFDEEMFLEDLDRLLMGDIACVICTHVSNVFGMIMPIKEIAMLCREREVPLIVDASQSAGCLPIDADGWGAAYVAMPGHKGLYGPQGIGLLLCGRVAMPEPMICGGTGSASLRQEMPDFLPDRLEAGTHNVPGIAGLLEGLKEVQRVGPVAVLAHEQALAAHAAEGLREIEEVEVFIGPAGTQTGVLSFRLESWDSEEAAAWLGEHGVAVRGGLHCAPLAHKTAGTLDTGTVRVSFSMFNTRREVGRFLGLVKRMAKGEK